MLSWIRRLGTLPVSKSLLITLAIELGSTALQVLRKQHYSCAESAGCPRGSPARPPQAPCLRRLGELSEEDVMANRVALRDGYRLLSSYPLGEKGVKLWVITEADRSVTTLLLPDEY